MPDPRCLFCNIANGKIPSFKIYEDEKLFAFLDINPATRGHTILTTKEHYPLFQQIPDQEVALMFQISKRISSLLIQALEAKGINLILSIGEAAGQRTPHTILHIIPRYEGDSVNITWEPQKMSEEDFKAVQNTLLHTISGKPEKKKEPEVIKEEKKKEEEVIKLPERVPSYWKG